MASEPLVSFSQYFENARTCRNAELYSGKNKTLDFRQITVTSGKVL